MRSRSLELVTADVVMGHGRSTLRTKVNVTEFGLTQRSASRMSTSRAMIHGKRALIDRGGAYLGAMYDV